MPTETLEEPPTFRVIGIESPGTDSEMLGVRPLVIRLPETVPGREDWCYWDEPGKSLQPNWPGGFTRMYFRNAQIMKLPGDKPYRAFRVQTAFLINLLGPRAQAEDVLALLPSDLIHGYQYDIGLEAIYVILDNAALAQAEYGKWAAFLDGLMNAALSEEQDWKRFDTILVSLGFVVLRGYTPEMRRRWYALSLARQAIHPSDDFAYTTKILLDLDYPSGQDRSRIFAEARHVEEDLRRRWLNQP